MLQKAQMTGNAGKEEYNQVMFIIFRGRKPPGAKSQNLAIANLATGSSLFHAINTNVCVKQAQPNLTPGQ